MSAGEHANFLVKKPTPGRTVGRITMLAFPFEVEIEAEPIPRTDYASPCRCARVYRLTIDGFLKLKRLGILRKRFIIDDDSKLPCICDCMGRVLR